MNSPSGSAASIPARRSAVSSMLVLVILAVSALLMFAQADSVSAQSPGIYLTATSLYVDENDEYWEYFQLSLASEPDGYVGVNIQIDEQTDARLVVGVINSYSQFVDCESGETCYIHINQDEWNDYQTVYVNALIDDNRAGGSGTIKVSAVSGDPDYDGRSREVSVTESDTVGAAMLFPDGRPSRISEGGSASFSVALAVEPYADVTLTVSSSHSDITFSPASLTFTSTNYSSKQSVTLRAKEDAIAQTATANIKLTASSSGDSDYDDLTGSFSIREVENDTARFVLSSYQNPLTITEGGDHTYSVRLDTEPTANVTVGVGVNGGDGDISVSPASLTFTPIKLRHEPERDREYQRGR